MIKLKLFCAFSFLFFFTLSFDAHSQDDNGIKKSSLTQKIDGEKYYVHIVEKGQTLYAIAKAYEVNTNDIVLENPDIAKDGLKVGAIIKIPFKSKKEKKKLIPEGNFQVHIVEKGETLYSLSKKYNLTSEQLSAVNPELKEGGLKIGMELRIPAAPASNANPSPVKDTVRVSPVISFKDSVMKVALFIPFFTEMNDGDKEFKNVYDKEIIYPKSQVGVTFYQGVKLALDSLERAGFKCKVFVYDTGNDSLKIETILKNPELKRMNLVIGPFYASSFNRVAEFAKLYRIPVVTPFSQVNKILLGNPYISKVTPGLNTQVDKVASYVSSSFPAASILVVHNEIAKEKIFVEILKKNLNSVRGKDSIIELSFKKAGIAGLKAKLIAGKNNVILVPSNDQAFVTELINKLYTEKGNIEVTLVGMESWNSFENLDSQYLNELKLHLPSSGYINFDDQKVKSFIRTFRDKNDSEPDKYAYQGYDIMMFFGSILKQVGPAMIFEMEDVKSDGLQAGFDFYKTAVESGFENKRVFILKYEDYKIVKAN